MPVTEGFRLGVEGVVFLITWAIQSDGFSELDLQ
jgi:hypothetical protein